MTQARLTGSTRQFGLSEVLRALYRVHHPDVVGTMEMMPDVVFVPQHAVGTVGNGGDEGWSIGDESAPVVTRINTNASGWVYGFRPETFASQFSFMMGHGQVVVTPVDNGFTVGITYADRDQHNSEFMRVVGAVSRLLEDAQMQ
jgi:hypothetical protein